LYESSGTPTALSSYPKPKGWLLMEDELYNLALNVKKTYNKAIVMIA
jgi:hypothetical protein